MNPSQRKLTPCVCSQIIPGTPTNELVTWVGDDLVPHWRANLQYLASLQLLLAYNSHSGALAALRNWQPGLVKAPWQSIAATTTASDGSFPAPRFTADIFWSSAQNAIILTPGAQSWDDNSLCVGDCGEHT